MGRHRRARRRAVNTSASQLPQLTAPNLRCCFVPPLPPRPSLPLHLCLSFFWSFPLSAPISSTSPYCSSFHPYRQNCTLTTNLRARERFVPQHHNSAASCCCSAAFSTSTSSSLVPPSSRALSNCTPLCGCEPPRPIDVLAFTPQLP